MGLKGVVIYERKGYEKGTGHLGIRSKLMLALEKKNTKI